MDIVSLIENANEKYATRVAYRFNGEEITFNKVYENAFKFAKVVSGLLPERSPVVVISKKNLLVPSCYLGIAMSNCFYVPISTEMPNSKIEAILSLTEAKLIICGSEDRELVAGLNYGGEVRIIEECAKEEVRGKERENIDVRRRNILDIDPLYVIFTSGSTGTPKGVVTNHQAVVDYLSTFVKTFDIKEDEVFGNQAPLDYIAGIRDIYIPMIVGCKTVFIPKNLFSIPKALFECLNENKITTICWVSAALSLCCQFNIFSEIKPMYVKKVFFTGSVFDVKHLNMWKSELKDAMFVNHYGPTEITASCTYFVVDNSVEYQKSVPIGKAFANRKVFVLNEKNEVAKVNEVGEICVSGKCLALGYYKNPEVTNKNFIQNPQNDIYPERIYLTGDLGYLGEDGNLVFVGRKDNQIKHMGHRVELGEIEENVLKNDKVAEACCVYNTKKSVITLYYSGSATSAEICKGLRENLPSFMIPRKLICLDSLPKLFNGKIDRQTLKKQVEEE